MKNIYKLNKIIVGLNIGLFIGGFFGVLFLPITGVVQVVCFLIYLSKWKSIEKDLTYHLKIYGILTLFTLLIQSSIILVKTLDILFWAPIISGTMLSIYFFIISSVQSKYYTNNRKLG